MGRSLVASIVGFSFALMTCSTAWSQATAQISGTVRDQSGAVLPGVQVTATQTATGLERETITNETGTYVMPNLPLGPYRLETGLPGFRSFVQSGIVLQVNANPVINVVMEVGQITEQVEVEANASLVETRSVGVGRIMQTEQIMELPLNGRNAQELLLLSGGAVSVPLGSSANTFPGRLLISSAGALGTSTDYNLDGIRHLDPWDGQPMILPFPDALAEFKIETSGLSAQQARSSAVGAVTKSGTNAFHGDLFEFVRNDLFNARPYFAIKGSTLKRNQFGGTLGGPILKNKLFFFGGFQGTTLRQDPASSFSFVPTAAMLTGDFTAFASTLCNPARALVLKAPFNNNRVDPALLNPAAVKLSALLPKADDACGRVSYGRTSNSNNWQIVARMDYQWSTKHSLFGRVLRAYQNDPSPFEYTPDNILNAANGTFYNADAYTLGSTYLINPTTVNSFRMSYSGDNSSRTAQSYAGYRDIGVAVNSKNPKSMELMVTSGFSLSSAGKGGFRTNFYQLADDVTMTRGAHQFGIGAHFGHARAIGISSNTTQGTFTFNGGVTGSGLADFLIGKVNSFTQGEYQQAYSRQNFRGVYGQDTWQMRRRLTVNYGLRWAPVLPIQDVRRPIPQVMNFDLNRYRQGIRSSVFVNAPPGFIYAGDPGFVQKNNGANAEKPRADLNNAYLAKFAPRVGLAWDVQGDGRTSIRASYGLNYEDPYGNSRLGSQSALTPWSTALRILTPAGGFENPFLGVPGGNPFPVTLSKTVPFTPLSDYVVAPGTLKPTTTQSWNINVQREIEPGTLLSLSYLGTQVTHIRAAEPLNPAILIPGVGDDGGNCFLNGQAVPFKVAPGAVCSSVDNTQVRRQLALVNPASALEIGRMARIVDGGTQNYHAALVSLQRRSNRGINISGNYTWSHCIGDYSARENGGAGINVTHTYLDPSDRKRDRANCDTDQRHVLNLTGIVETPKFANRTLTLVATGWRLSGIYKAASGSSSLAFRTVGLGDPATSTTSGNAIDRCLCDSAAQRPDLVMADIYKDKTGRPRTQYLNPAAFASPAIGTLGTAGRGIVRLPYAWQFDMALSRVFRFRETQSLEFRAEAYNVTNRFRSGDINLNFTSSQFGQVLNALDPRIMQFALKYLF
jgi:hypothetical protein